MLQAQDLARVAAKGAAAAHAAHAAHAADPAALADCHARMCTLPRRDRHDPGHDAAACRHAMTSGIGVLVEDAGYHSEANLTAPGPARLIADAKTRDLARRQPASGPRPRMPPPWKPTRTGWPPRGAARFTSAAPPTSRACTPASKTKAACAASASAACPTPPANSSRRPRAQPPGAHRHQLNQAPSRPAARSAAGPQHPRKESNPQDNTRTATTAPPAKPPRPNPGTGARSATPPQESATPPEPPEVTEDRQAPNASAQWDGRGTAAASQVPEPLPPSPAKPQAASSRMTPGIRASVRSCTARKVPEARRRRMRIPAGRFICQGSAMCHGDTACGQGPEIRMKNAH